MEYGAKVTVSRFAYKSATVISGISNNGEYDVVMRETGNIHTVPEHWLTKI